MNVRTKDIFSSLKLSITAVATVILVLALESGTIEGNVWIWIGYALVTLFSTFPVYLLSCHQDWIRAPRRSVKRLYAPVMLFVVLTLTITLYSSIVYNYRWTDYFRPGAMLNPSTSVGSFWLVFGCMALLFLLQYSLFSEKEEVLTNRVAAPKEGRLVKLTDGSKGGAFELDIDKFLYAMSDANYLILYTLANDGSTGELRLRMTIASLEERLKEYDEILRCHRAYIANLSLCDFFKGNSAKGEIHFKGLHNVVPVSKTYIPTVKARLRK